MSFWRTFLGSFHSPEVYRAARHDAAGWGVRYSLQLFFLIIPLTVLTIILLHGGEAQGGVDVPAILLIVAIALGLRGVMLLTLAIAAQLLALLFKPRLNYSAGFRLAGIAYTPVALLDALAFLLTGIALFPALLLGGGVLMLLAALAATR